MGMIKTSNDGDIKVTVGDINPSTSETATTSFGEDKVSFVTPGAQSVTTIARSSEAATAVTYSHVASFSSPGSAQLVDTATPSSHPLVPVSQDLTRPILLSQTSSPSLLQISHYSEQPPTTQLGQPPTTQLGQPPTTQLFPSLQQDPSQRPIHQQIVFPQQLVEDPKQYQLIHPQKTQSHQPPPYYLLQSLLVNVDHPQQPSQQSQRSPVEQAQLSPIPQQRNPGVPNPVHVGQRPYSPKTPTVSSKQSHLLRQLLVQNLLQQRQKQLQRKQEQGQQQVLTVQQLVKQYRKTVPSHTVQYRQYTGPDHSDPLEISVPLKEPPPYHSVQRVPEVSVEGTDQASDSGGLSPMTLGTTEPSIVPEKMESRLGSFDTFINTCGDMPFSTDFIDASIYASSPNSLFMYDQEKIDMQSTLASSSTCTSVDTTGIAEDFELKAQYEISQDLSSNLPACVTTAGSHVFSLSYDGGCVGQMWGDVAKQTKEDVMMKSESISSASTPTLAELNFNLDLLEDIETVISVDMNSATISTPRDSKPVIKQEPEGMYDRERVFSPSSQVAPGTFRAVYTKLVNAQPVQETKVDIKLEPEEPDTKPKANDQLAPLPQAVNASWTKLKTQSSENPQTAVKQLDLSDARTLRHLLVNQRTVSPVKIPRKRTVSESATLKSATRKRTYPAGESMDRKWEEIKEFIHMETSSEEVTSPVCRPSPVKRERRRNYSECSTVTLTSNEDDESDSDRDIDDDSDSDLEDGHDIGSLSPTDSLIGEKDKQYFWQYNVQSKGPKGTRAHFEMEEDPHVLNDFEDPVFDPTMSNLAGVGISIKHGGKARKGDGNDIVPSPKKLCQIGLQLRKINRQINDFLPVSELPSAARNKSRKEKNKLASRACRLKKKAQHEANKVKLHGLEMEHRQLLTVIRLMRRKLIDRLRSKVKEENQLSMTETLEQLISEHLTTMIGGNTADYVNKVVHNVEAGDVTGGLSIKATRSYPKELHN